MVVRLYGCEVSHLDLDWLYRVTKFKQFKNIKKVS